MTFETPPIPKRRPALRAPQDFVSGLTVLVLAAVVLWALSRVPTTRFQSISPTLFPRLCTYTLAVLGVLLTMRGFLRDGPPLDPWPLRGISFVTLAIVLFGMLINVFGYLLAGFVTVVLAGLGSGESKRRELLLLAVALVIISYLLFTAGLRLSLPVFAIPGLTD
jgi:putative tricarboxylic transport membrane protein